ncbi:DNA sulfur modification protein DndB [Paenibacillus sp. PCH8]|uniref:DNA sulfur modification protein DndB n=1 Tax=Paenibacillus sp. PCH8 TaxID=2066524 RepID=UPI0015E3DDE6|nr:DNA sulfur modification protein DndB [Paenibacillus sp. PCH8]
MKIDRSNIEKLISIQLEIISASKKLKYQFKYQLIELNIPVEVIDSLLKNEEYVAQYIPQIDTSILYGVCQALFTVTGNEQLEPNQLFGKREIRDAQDNLRSIVQKRMELPISFPDTTKLKYDSYITKIAITDLVKMSESQLIVYDYETQRGAKYELNQSGGVVKTPIVNKASVKRIASKMADNQYFEDMITLNVYSTEVDPLTYYEDSKTLTINDGAVISILDGFHRLQGAIAALQSNPNLDLDMILSIRSYDHETAQKYFGQINTINVLKKERRDELSQERMSDKVVANLQRKSEIGKQIASSTTVNELAGELTTFDIMSYSIDRMYHFDRQLDVIKTSNYLNDFFTYLVGSYPNEFSINANKRENVIMSHPLMFIGYIALSKFMKDHDIGLDQIEQYVNSIIFEVDKLEPLLNAKKSLTGNKRLRNQLIDYFESKLEGNNSE